MRKLGKGILLVLAALVCIRLYYVNIMTLEEKVIFWEKVSDFTGNEYVYVNGAVKMISSAYTENSSGPRYEDSGNSAEYPDTNSLSPSDSGRFGWNQAYSNYVENRQFQNEDHDISQEPAHTGHAESSQDKHEDSKPAQNSQTVPSEQVQDRLVSVPAEYRGNTLLRSRMLGSCESLTGDVLITVIFANDPSSFWADMEVQPIITGHEGVTNAII